MNTFKKNYWSLYLDFLNDFKELEYGGFSLPYLCHFKSLFWKNVKLRNDLYSENFTQQLKNQVKHPKEIQEVFNDFVQSHTKKTFVKNKNGAAVIHDVYNLLRFPENSISSYLDPSKTIRLGEGENPNKKEMETAPPVTKRKRIKFKTALRLRQSKNKGEGVVDNNTAAVKYFSDYSINTEAAVKQISDRAREIFKSHGDHHMYSDRKFQNIFLMQLSKIINRIEESRNFLNDVSVSCIVVPSTHYFQCRTLALVAAERGIPAICMQHGIIGDEVGYLPKIAAIDAVYGNFEVEWYKKMGAPEASLEIVGHPRFDQAFLQPKLTRTKFNHRLGLDATRKTLMIVVRGKRNIDMWREFLNNISETEIADLNIIVKDSPGAPNILAKEFSFVHDPKTIDLYDIIPNVDYIVSYCSTVGLEAMLLDKPVFILTDKFPGYSGYFDLLGEMVQHDPQKLVELMTNCLKDSEWEVYADKKRYQFLSHAYPDISMSRERLRLLIKKLTN